MVLLPNEADEDIEALKHYYGITQQGELVVMAPRRPEKNGRQKQQLVVLFQLPPNLFLSRQRVKNC